MVQRGFEKNQVYLVGNVATEMLYDHEVCGEAFYQFYLSVKRLSGYSDIIPLIISERLIDIQKSYRGSTIGIYGQLRSHNKKSPEGSHLQVKVFVYRFERLEAGSDHRNEIQLDGYISKEAQYRVTPHFREVSDMLVAVNRQYEKSDYIPCIVWGRNAMYAATKLGVGMRVKISGRIQSREYIKKTESGISIKRKVYEVSVNVLECVERDELYGTLAEKRTVAEDGLPYQVRSQHGRNPEDGGNESGSDAQPVL